MDIQKEHVYADVLDQQREDAEDLGQVVCTKCADLVLGEEEGNCEGCI